MNPMLVPNPFVAAVMAVTLVVVGAVMRSDRSTPRRAVALVVLLCAFVLGPISVVYLAAGAVVDVVGERVADRLWAAGRYRIGGNADGRKTIEPDRTPVDVLS